MTLIYLTAGESHGPGLTGILAGLPAKITISESFINEQLKRRQAGYGRGNRMKIESDHIIITGGVRHGFTLGSPVGLFIENKDFKNWRKEMSVSPVKNFKSKKAVTCARPGHADLAGAIKYNQKDLRNILERASARETAMRTAIGAICRQFLKEFSIEVESKIIGIGDETKNIKGKIDNAKKLGDTLGGVFEIVFHGVPVGLGSHASWENKLNANVTRTLMSIQAIKGVSVGLGFETANLSGSKVHDAIHYKNKRFSRSTNNAGGIEGGMSNGENIVLRAAMKPIATLMHPLDSVDVVSKKKAKASVERSDVCAVQAASVVAENILCFDVAKAFLDKFGGDSLDEIKRNFEGYLKQVKGY